jgi:serine/threonine protein kinase
MASDPVPVPRTHLGPYKVSRLIGRGGMGEVYEGVDEGLDRRVALKVLSAQPSSQSESVERFLIEGRAVARINHRNVVQVYFAGSADGAHFIALEFVQGPSLEGLLVNSGVIQPATAISFTIDTAKGLNAALGQGIIHRDIKPANLLYSESEDMVKITDFGLAKAMECDQGMTQTGTIMGTPMYMSPEQAQGNELDHRADIYSLGATLYCLLTGSPPFVGENFMALILQHINQPVPEIQGFPPALNRLIQKMMAKAPEGRHADYEALLEDLESVQNLRYEHVAAPRPASTRDSAIATMVQSPPSDATDAACGGGDGPKRKSLSESDENLLSDLDDMMSLGL